MSVFYHGLPRSLRIAAMLVLVFTIQKLMGWISWSWWWVISPFWLPAGAVVTVVVMFLLFLLLIFIIEWINGQD